MDADTHVDRPVGPLLRGRLGPCDDVEPRLHRARGRREDDVEAVPLGLDLGPATPRDHVAHEPTVGLEKVDGGPVAVRLDERGVAAQVREQEPAGEWIPRRVPLRRPREGRGERAGGRIARLCVLRQRPADHLVDLGRGVGPELCERRRRVVEVGEDLCDLAVPGEWRPPAEALEGDTAEAVHVRPAVDRPSQDLLRRDVADAPDELALLRRRALASGLFGEPEVGEIGVLEARLGARCEEDVAGLDVPVDQADRVRRVEGRRDLVDDAHGRIDGQTALRRQAALEVRPRDVAHRQEQVAFDLVGLEDRDDVGVVERCGRPRFRDEAPPDVGIPGELRGDHLERDPASQPRVLSEVDRAEAAPADQPLDAIRGDPVARREPLHRGDSDTLAGRRRLTS